MELALEEGRLLQELDHPNIVKCHEIFKPTPADPKAYLVMELMECSLNDVLDLAGPLDEHQLACLFKQIVLAVEHCHSQGLVHQDLKPQNVLISTDENGIIKMVKLADFGLCRKTTDELVVGTGINCTLKFAAPELLTVG